MRPTKASLALPASALALSLAACGGEGDNIIVGVSPEPPTALDLNFGLVYEIELGGDGISDAILADFDGNGSVELVHAGALDGSLRIATDVLPGDPVVTDLQVIVPGRAPLRLVEGDFDGDGMGGFAALCSDVAMETGMTAGGLGETEVVVYEIGSDGLFTEETRFLVSGFAVSGVAGPLFGGTQDQLLLADLETNTIDVYEQVEASGELELAASVTGPPPPPSVSLTTAVFN